MLYLNREAVSLDRYYGGELKATYKRCVRGYNTFLWLCRGDGFEAELFLLQAIMTDIADEGGIAELLMPYIPFSRNDHFDRRAGDTVRANTLKAFAKIINGLDFTGVGVFDPHSNVAPMLLDRCRVLSVVEELSNAALVDMCDKGDVAFLFPDAGAEKRYSSMEFFKGRRCFVASKRRDKETGEITGFRLDGDFSGVDKVLIVDDLCSAGGTFIMAAEALKEQGVSDVRLVVTHCEDNIKNGRILDSDFINKVYTSDSLLTIGHPKIRVAYNFYGTFFKSV